MKTAATEPRWYRVTWKGIIQPLGIATDFNSIKLYIQMCIDMKIAQLFEFEIFDQFGQLRTNIINEPDADPTLIKNYYNGHEETN